MALILVLTIASATQDMAIDAYTVALVGPEEQGAANGVRASAYRVALVLSAAAWSPSPVAALGRTVRAPRSFSSGSGSQCRQIPRVDIPAEARRHWLAPFAGWIATWRAIPLILFVLTYKLGESRSGPMVKPLGGPGAVAARDRAGPDGARDRAFDRRRAGGRRLHATLRHPDRPVGAGLPQAISNLG